MSRHWGRIASGSMTSASVNTNVQVSRRLASYSIGYIWRITGSYDNPFLICWGSCHLPRCLIVSSPSSIPVSDTYWFQCHLHFLIPFPFNYYSCVCVRACMTVAMCVWRIKTDIFPKTMSHPEPKAWSSDRVPGSKPRDPPVSVFPDLGFQG